MDQRNLVQLYGGIMAEAPSNSDEEGTSKKGRTSQPSKRVRKTSSKSPEDEETGKKSKRGRPRVDAQDENAVEVRKPFCA
jgi:hypothetical protein